MQRNNPEAGSISSKCVKERMLYSTWVMQKVQNKGAVGEMSGLCVKPSTRRELYSKLNAVNCKRALA